MASDVYNRDAAGKSKQRRNRNQAFTDASALVAPPPPNFRVQSVALEAWVSNPNLRVFSTDLEAWITPGTVNERVQSVALEAWVINSGNMRVAKVTLEAWVPAPIYSLSISQILKAPKFSPHSNWINRSISPVVGPPAIGFSVNVDPSFPTLPGLMFPISKELVYGNLQQRTASGKVFKTAEWNDPVWMFTLRFEFLRQNPQFLEQQAMLGQFLQMLGQKGTFLYQDPDDHVATNVIFANAINHGPPLVPQTVFPLYRNFYDPSGNILATARVYSASNVTISVGTNADGSGGTPTTAFTLSPNGIVVFNSSPVILGAPGSNNFISWSGNFQYVCRFEEDQLDFQGLWQSVFQLNELKFKTVKPVGIA